MEQTTRSPRCCELKVRRGVKQHEKQGQKGFTLVELLIVLAIISMIASILIPNLLDALQKSKQKASVADIRNIGIAWYSWMTDSASASAAGQETVRGILDWTGDFTGTCDADSLAEILEGGAAGATISQLYLQKMPREDGWDNALEFGSVVNCGDASSYGSLSTAKRVIGVRSLGRDGLEDTEFSGSYPTGTFPVTQYDGDIVWSDGYFVRIPGAVGSASEPKKGGKPKK